MKNLKYICRIALVQAEPDMQMVPAAKMELDICGHYARPDVLKFVAEDK